MHIVAPYTGMSCFPSEPILVTSSPDNTIKQVSIFLVKLQCVNQNSDQSCKLHEKKMKQRTSDP